MSKIQNEKRAVFVNTIKVENKKRTIIFILYTLERWDEHFFLGIFFYRGFFFYTNNWFQRENIFSGPEKYRLIEDYPLVTFFSIQIIQIHKKSGKYHSCDIL